MYKVICSSAIGGTKTLKTTNKRSIAISQLNTERKHFDSVAPHVNLWIERVNYMGDLLSTLAYEDGELVERLY